jgi:tetratricopeptide (TPR) repeat protein
LGGSLLELGDAGKAVELLERARATREAKLGADHADTLATLSVLALAYREVGRLPEAVDLSEQVRDAVTRKHGAGHPETLTAMDNLARVYNTAGKRPQAIALFEQVRDARVKMLGPDAPDTLTTLNNLAAAYLVVGRGPEAVALLEQVRDAALKKPGPDHFETLKILSNLALAYQETRRRPEAVALFEQVRDVKVRKLGADHPATLTTLNNLAMAYEADGKRTKAIALLEPVRDAITRKLGADHPLTLTTLNNLAMAYEADGKRPKAIALFEQAAAGVEKRRFQHEYAGRILRNTIDAYEEAGQLDKAEAWLRKWLAVVKERGGADSSAYGDDLGELGLLLLEQKKWPEAETPLKECLALREKLQPGSWATFIARSALGEALLGQKNFEAAEPLLLAGYEGMKKLEDQIKPQFRDTPLGDALDRLVRLYDALGNKDKAAEWRKKLDFHRERERQVKPTDK